eukprot:TRINITY_DN13007_c0_g1_i1.p1 TRINITY_DN13007_c0_g1~~TRINITY_DN13007_c0_g1_i1.p1  ORF type:complete len:119 (-),score=9.69 TRINITY_DN13007_c0_g1_i1:336-692(-)
MYSLLTREMNFESDEEVDNINSGASLDFSDFVGYYSPQDIVYRDIVDEENDNEMKPSVTYAPSFVQNELEEQGSAAAMDVDDAEPLELLNDGSAESIKLADADFFNAFEDDFDDSDIA